MEVKRWDTIAMKDVDSPAEVESFLDRYESLCRESGLCLGHEDGHGSFYVHEYDQSAIEWVRSAALCIYKAKQVPPLT